MERFEPPIAEGGRLCESSCCRAVITELDCVLPGRFSKPPFALAEPLTEELPGRPFAFAAPLPSLPTRLPAIPGLLNVCTRECAAAAAGLVRAITARLSMLLDGRATCELKFAAPSELCCVGRMPTEFETLALFNWDAVRCWPLRLMRSPLTKALCEAVVTARALCAFTKLTLRTFVLFKTFTLRMNVLWTLITVMKLRLQPNHGKNGSPQPSGNQPAPKPNPKPQPPPKKPTKAGP